MIGVKARIKVKGYHYTEVAVITFVLFCSWLFGWGLKFQRADILKFSSHFSSHKEPRGCTNCTSSKGWPAREAKQLAVIMMLKVIYWVNSHQAPLSMGGFPLRPMGNRAFVHILLAPRYVGRARGGALPPKGQARVRRSAWLLFLANVGPNTADYVLYQIISGKVWYCSFSHLLGTEDIRHKILYFLMSEMHN
jgi:hypothetical protein